MQPFLTPILGQLFLFVPMVCFWLLWTIRQVTALVDNSKCLFGVLWLRAALLNCFIRLLKLIQCNFIIIQVNQHPAVQMSAASVAPETEQSYLLWEVCVQTKIVRYSFKNGNCLFYHLVSLALWCILPLLRRSMQNWPAVKLIHVVTHVVG